MARVSGNGGSVTSGGADVANVRKWTCDIECDIKEGTDSTSAPWADAIAGNKRWAGNFSVYLEDGEIPTGLVEGTIYAVELKMTSTHKLSGNIVLGKIGVEADIEGAEMEGCDFDFVGAGAVTKT